MEFEAAEFIEIEANGGLMGLLNAQGCDLGPDDFPYRCRNFAVIWELVRGGFGIGILDDRIGDADPGAERAASDFAAFAFPFWTVAHRDSARSRHLRNVFDALVAGFDGRSAPIHRAGLA